MPVKPPSICGCGFQVAAGQLCQCQRRRKLEADKRRPNAHKRGYSRRWQAEAKAFLALPENRQCAVCGAPANAVDHIIAHKGDSRLFWNRSNWRPICIPCNSRKNIREEGGFGRAMTRRAKNHG